MRTKTISQIRLSRKPSRAAAISSKNRFSDVLEPIDNISKSSIVCVDRFRGISCFSNPQSSEVRVTATLNMSLNAMTSPAIADPIKRRALYELNEIGNKLFVPSTVKTTFPIYVVRSALSGTTNQRIQRNLMNYYRTWYSYRRIALCGISYSLI